jgi:hypothetical protein
MRAVLPFATSSRTSEVQEEDNQRVTARATRNANTDAADSDNSADRGEQSEGRSEWEGSQLKLDQKDRFR